jgi:hypothetical protein
MKSIAEHVRKRTGTPLRVGTMVAIGDEGDNKVRIGWTKCKYKMDKFDPIEGAKRAAGRANGLKTRGRRLNHDLDIHHQEHELPQSMEEVMAKFIVRSALYFKTDHVEVYGFAPHRVSQILQVWNMAKAEKTKQESKVSAVESILL